MKLGDIVDIIGTSETGEIIQIAKVSKKEKVFTTLLYQEITI